MNKGWDRRLAVVVLVGISLAPTSTLVAMAANQPVHAESRVAKGILPAALTFFKSLVDRALTSSPAPAPGGPKTSLTASGDNGAGIDPNGR
jgi:hypothetical protein